MVPTHFVTRDVVSGVVVEVTEGVCGGGEDTGCVDVVCGGVCYNIIFNANCRERGSNVGWRNKKK